MEQTASAAYPNVLVADYLRKAGRASSDQLAKAESLVREGYQRMLTFQHASGGFGWWTGGESPQVWVTAYALHLLRDTSRVVDVDARVIERARAWLLARRGGGGMWTDAGQSHGVKIDRVALTAYVAWAIGGDAQAAEALEKHVEGGDAYRLSLVALALQAGGNAAAARRAAANLARLEWSSTGSLCYGYGDCGRVETAGLAVQAFLSTGAAPERAAKGIEFIVQKRRDGDWGSTQATVQALRALTGASQGGRPGERVTLTFRAGGKSRSMDVTLGEGAVPSVDLTDFLGHGPIAVEGPEGVSLTVQAVARHHEPWKREDGALRMSVAHPDVWTVGRAVKMNASIEGAGKMIVAEVGLAPGAVPVGSSLERLVSSRAVQRFEVQADRVVFYLDALNGKATFDFDVVPRLAAEARVRPGRAYAFYDPDRMAVAPTAGVRVTP